MKEPTKTEKPQRPDEPIWCEGCRVRIAPYDKTAKMIDDRIFHSHCLLKAMPTLFPNVAR